MFQCLLVYFISVISGLISVDYLLSSCVLYLCSFACLDIFGWLPDIVSFTLLAAGHLCISINIFELCSGIQLLLRNNFILSGVASLVCQVGLKQCSNRANYFLLMRQDFYEYFPYCPMNYTFSSVTDRNRLFPACVTAMLSDSFG